MKTINTKKSVNKHIEIFKDPISGKYTGFSGIIDVCDSLIFVNTQTGVGYDEILNKLTNMINYLANKYRFKNNSIEDNRQNVILYMLEGLPKFNPYKNTKLSTFLQMRVERKLINDIRNENSLCKNATVNNEIVFGVDCECGNGYFIRLSNKIDLKNSNCPRCKAPADKQKITSYSDKELSLDTITQNSDSKSDQLNVASDLFNYDENNFDDVIIMCDIQKWLNKEDPRVAKAIELVCFNDYSLSKAAEQVGLTGQWVSLKFKKLRNKFIVKDMLNR